MDEMERKRKREIGLDTSDVEIDGPGLEGSEQPGEGSRKTKKQKTNGEGVQSESTKAAAEEESARRKAKAEKRKEKRDLKKEKVERKREKAEVKKAQKQDRDLEEAHVGVKTKQKTNDEDESDEEVRPDDIEAMDVSGLAEDIEPAQGATESPTSNSTDEGSPVFDVSANQSTASSSSSIAPPTDAPSTSAPNSLDYPATTFGAQPLVPSEKAKKEKAFNMPKINQEELQSRLRARIEELRARRKADGSDGGPARSRQDLLEARRKKSDARKQHKKELRVKAKQEEERLNNQRLQGSGSPLSADLFSPRSPMQQDNNFSFGRIAFEDGQQADSTLSGVTQIKKKGPQDPKTALEAAKKKASRLGGYDETKRADIEEKDAWLNAKKKAHGERVRDDQNLLKKALKRKEKTKSKSEKEWNERTEGVRKGQEMRQRKREDNIAKRKEEKGGKKGKPKAAKSAKPKKKGRPGFEGGRSR